MDGEENNILLEKYKDFTGEELHNLFLPNRTVRSIECHAAASWSARQELRCTSMS